MNIDDELMVIFAEWADKEVDVDVVIAQIKQIFLSKLPKEKPVRRDSKSLHAKLSGRPYVIDQFNAGYNRAIKDIKTALEPTKKQGESE